MAFITKSGIVNFNDTNNKNISISVGTTCGTIYLFYKGTNVQTSAIAVYLASYTPKVNLLISNDNIGVNISFDGNYEEYFVQFTNIQTVTDGVITWSITANDPYNAKGTIGSIKIP
jgi:hypothetical protein